VNNPRTEGQVTQRSKFTATIDFLKTITTFIRVGFQEFSNGRMTAFNAAKGESVYDFYLAKKSQFYCKAAIAYYMAFGHNSFLFSVQKCRWKYGFR